MTKFVYVLHTDTDDMCINAYKLEDGLHKAHGYAYQKAGIMDDWAGQTTWRAGTGAGYIEWFSAESYNAREISRCTVRKLFREWGLDAKPFEDMAHG